MVSYQKRQRGVVLLVSLVFLIALTAVASALMQVTTTDMKMSGATDEKTTAVQETLSATDEVIFNEVTQTAGTNAFTDKIESFPKEKVVSAADTSAVLSVANPNNLESDCPHSRSGSSVQVFKCNVLSVQVTRKYGRKKHQDVVVQSGVAQQLLNIGN